MIDCSTESGSIPFAEYASEMACRREVVGPVEIPRNSGRYGTESKRAVLKALEQIGAW